MRLWESILWYNSDLTILGVFSLDYLIYFFLPLVSLLLFFVSVCGLLFKQLSLIQLVLIFEILVLSLNLFILCLTLYFDNIEGYLLFLILLTLAAAESSIGISLIILLYRYRDITIVNSLNYLLK
jgi:NADH-quinone oxidoreductase subunit K